MMNNTLTGVTRRRRWNSQAISKRGKSTQLRLIRSFGTILNIWSSLSRLYRRRRLHMKDTHSTQTSVWDCQRCLCIFNTTLFWVVNHNKRLNHATLQSTIKAKLITYLMQKECQWVGWRCSLLNILEASIDPATRSIWLASLSLIQTMLTSALLSTVMIH